MCKKKECIFWIELVLTGNHIVRNDDSWHTYIILKSMNIVTYISLCRAALYQTEQEKSFFEEKEHLKRGQTHLLWFLPEEHYNRGRKKRQSEDKGMKIRYELKHVKDNLFYFCFLRIKWRLQHVGCRKRVSCMLLTWTKTFFMQSMDMKVGVVYSLIK